MQVSTSVLDGLPATVPMWSKNADVVTAATILGVSRSLVMKQVKDGTIPSLRLGGRVLVPVSGLRRLLGESE